jgi:hypothetical protein
MRRRVSGLCVRMKTIVTFIILVSLALYVSMASTAHIQTAINL